MTTKNNNIEIGWAQTDITPQESVSIAGQLHARKSEGVETPLTATALVLQTQDDYVIMVSVEVVNISDELRQSVRYKVAKQNSDIDSKKILLNATHTHTSADIRPHREDVGVDIDVMDINKCVDFMAERIAEAIKKAWENKEVGAIAYGQGNAFIGSNRRWTDDKNRSKMYGLSNQETFRHIEGYEDHFVNLLATYDYDNNLTGLVTNIPCPSQVVEHNYKLSSDYWHDTRIELRKRFGENIYVLGQCSAAGDISPHPMYEKQAHERMLHLKERSHRQELAKRISDCVEDILPAISKDIQSAPILEHQVEVIDLPLNKLTQKDVDDANREIEKLQKEYEAELKKLEDNPELRQQTNNTNQSADPNQPDVKQPQHWYVPVTKAYLRKMWHGRVIERFEKQQKGENTYPTEVHILKIGDIALASTQFEYYLDFGIQIKVRSKAIQTFIVQLAGPGTYLPSPRSVAGGGYGSVPASNVVGPEAGQVLADYIVENINSMDFTIDEKYEKNTLTRS